MAVMSDYTSGTISLANGSTTVTGTGTLFDVAKFREGDTLQIQNLTAVIARVDSNTQLTLTEPWTGTTLTDAPYRARYLPDGARVTAQSTTLIELLGNGVLQNIAELPVEEGKMLIGNAAGQYVPIGKDEVGTPDPNGSLGELAELADVDNLTGLATLTLAANKILNTDGSGNLTQSDITAAALVLLKLAGTAATDQLPYFTGSDGAGLTPLTAFARTVLDDANGAAMWATMGATETRVLNSGYVKLPSGIILQRGVWWTGNGSDVTLPIAYPTTNRFVIASVCQRTSASPSLTVMTGYESQTAFAANVADSTTGVAVEAVVNWFSMGW